MHDVLHQTVGDKLPLYGVVLRQGCYLNCQAPSAITSDRGYLSAAPSQQAHFAPPPDVEPSERLLSTTPTTQPQPTQ